MISGCVEVGGPWATTRPSLTTTTESARAIVSATDSTAGQLDVPDTARAARERLVQRLRQLLFVLVV
jgi:hypothetical protein